MYKHNQTNRNVTFAHLLYISLQDETVCNGANETRGMQIHMQAFIKQRRGHNRLKSTLANKVEQG